MSGNIFDEKILKTQAFSFLHEFLTDIIDVFPEYKDAIIEKYNPFLSRDQERIQGDNQEKCDIAMEFINNLSKYTKQITDKDDSMFVDDLYLLHKVNFKDIWCSKISDTTRGKIWNYLQTFSMLSITINSNKDLTKIMSSLNNIVKGEASETENNELNAVINNLKKLSTSLTKGDDDDGEPPVPDLSGEGVEDKFNSFFSGSKIGDLAKEIAGDLNVEKMVAENKDKPEDLLKNLFSGGGGGGAEGGGKFNIMNVVENISSKINKKIADGDIKEDDLMKEAQNMMSSMQGNSLFGNLFNQTSAAMGQAGGGGGGGAGAAPDISGMLNMLGGLGGAASAAGGGAEGAPDMSGMLNMLGGLGGAAGGDGGGAPDMSGMLSMLGGLTGGDAGGAGDKDADINSILGIGESSTRAPTSATAPASSDRNVAARQRLQKKLQQKKESKKD
jgi:hypothetical protein